MSFPAALARKKEAANNPRLGVDLRRHKRYAINLLGRFMRADRHEYACRLIDISVGGAAISTPVQVADGEQIVAYIDEIGGIEGNVMRVFDGGFAMSIRATRHKREKLAARITWLVNRSELGGLEDRVYDRAPPSTPHSVLKLAEGITVRCQLIDVSLSGASVATEARPPIGAEVTLGRLKARVMRHHERGIGVRFLDVQEPEAIKRNFG